MGKTSCTVNLSRAELTPCPKAGGTAVWLCQPPSLPPSHLGWNQKKEKSPRGTLSQGHMTPGGGTSPDNINLPHTMQHGWDIPQRLAGNQSGSGPIYDPGLCSRRGSSTTSKGLRTQTRDPHLLFVLPCVQQDGHTLGDWGMECTHAYKKTRCFSNTTEYFAYNHD